MKRLTKIIKTLHQSLKNKISNSDEGIVVMLYYLFWVILIAMFAIL